MPRVVSLCFELARGAPPPRPAVPMRLWKSQRTHTAGSVALVIASATLSACAAYHSEYVSVAPLVISVAQESPKTLQETQLDVACPTSTGVDFAFTDLVKGNFRQDGPGYFWARQSAPQASPLAVTCPAQRSLVEYIGTPPSPEKARRRRIFVGFVGEPELYRILLERASVMVEVTDREAAKRRLPSTLKGDLRQKPWGREIIDAHERFYQTIRWESTSKVAVTNVQGAADGSVTAVTMTIRR